MKNNTLRRQPLHDDAILYIPDNTEAIRINTTAQNNERNSAIQNQWRMSSAFPTNLCRNNRATYRSEINKNWLLRYGQPCHSSFDKALNSKLVQFSSYKVNAHSDDISNTMQPLPHLSNDDDNDKENASNPIKKRPKTECLNNAIRIGSKVKSDLLHNMQANLHSRAKRKITRIATWNINNGFDHLAIASIMAKKDIDILALQEPRISYSTTDDVWISTMRKELRKCKYEIITSQYSYLIFDEQTAGPALASIIRQSSQINGRLLSVTFKSNDIWEVHTVISLYAVTNAKSGKKYARSQNSRKAVSAKLTKALNDEICYLQETFGDAPITIVGDYQDTVYSDSRDNIGIIGRKPNPKGPLQLLLNLGFQSAFHMKHPNKQQVTRWNGSINAGRHIDLQMLNDSAASLLVTVKIDDTDIRNHITSDHLIIIADYNIQKVEQVIIDSYRTKINFRKIAGIKMKCKKKILKCTITSSEKSCYSITFDDTQFMSCMVQDELTMLDRWQHEANSDKFDQLLTNLENSMYALEHDINLEDNKFNSQFDSDISHV